MRHVRRSDLETNRFGVRFGRLDAAGIEASDLNEEIRAADRAGFQIVSTRVDATALDQVRLLEDAGFRIMDTLVYYCRALPFQGDDGQDVTAAVSALPAWEADACAGIARSAFHGYVGHYHADPRLADDAADDAYADWAHRLVATPSDGQIALGAYVDNELKGFTIGSMNADGTSEIVLNAVHPALQRAGLYSAMLRRYLDEAGARGDNEVVISTQLQNYRVQRVWSRYGFVMFKSFHTLHRWSRVAD